MTGNYRMILEEDGENTIIENEVFESAESLPNPGMIILQISIGWYVLKMIIIIDFVTCDRLMKHLKGLETKLLAKLKAVEKAVDQNANVVKEFMSDYESQRELDIYAFADQSERSDYGSNLLKANCVLITGNCHTS